MSTTGADVGSGEVVRSAAKGGRSQAQKTPRVVPHLSVAERVARGRAARGDVPRSSHADFSPAARRPDPVALLESQAASRVPELVPIRYGRMLVSPFTFYRGAALIMAADLASTPSSGLRAQLCGDAHLSNFGLFASAERRLVFDLNDFDETLPGPWEWDVKRLAVSMEVAGRDNNYSDKQRRAIVLETVAGYREAMRGFAGMRALDVWYARAEVDELMAQIQSQITKAQRKRTDKTLAKARTSDSMTAFAKLTRVVDGEPQIVPDPPLIERVSDLAPGSEGESLIESLHALLRLYRESLQTDRRVLLEEFQLVDLARKVVGVGSVGTRAWIALLLGRDEKDPLFLQFKEAQSSVLEDFTAKSEYGNHGQRVVAGQQLDAGIERHLPGLGPRRDQFRRAASGLLRSPAQGLEGVIRVRGSTAAGHGPVRPGVRVDACPRACSLWRSNRDRLLPRWRRRVRPRDRRLLRRLRRPERARLRRPQEGGRRWKVGGSHGSLGAANY